MTGFPAVGSGYRPSAWCHRCHAPYPVGEVCRCEAGHAAAQRRAEHFLALIDSASIRRNTLALLAERYPQLPSTLQLERWRL